VALSCVLGKDTYCCFPYFGQSVYPLWWPSLTKDMQTEQLLFWKGMTDIWFKQRVRPIGWLLYILSESNLNDVSFPGSLFHPS